MRQRLLASLVCLGASVACHEGTFSLGIGPADELPETEVPAGGSAGYAGDAGSSGLEAPSGGTSSAAGSAGSTSSGGSGSSGATGGIAGAGGSAGVGGSDAGTGGVTAAQGRLSLLSVASDGTPADDHSINMSMSADGRFAVFESKAANLVPFDTNSEYDVFLHDRDNNTTIRVSVNELGEESNGPSIQPALSRDGTRIALVSYGTNLGGSPTNSLLYLSKPFDGLGSFVPGLTPVTAPGAPSSVTGVALSQGGEVAVYYWNTDNVVDVFAVSTGDGIHKRMNECNGVFVDIDGGPPRISADGKRVAFDGWAGDLMGVFATDFDSAECQVISVGFDGGAANGPSYNPALSDDGRFVAFTSSATNLTPGGDDDGAIEDVFVRDLVSQTTERIEIGAGGPSYAPVLSSDGRRLAFVAAAAPLQPNIATSFGLYVHDLETGQTFEIARREGDVAIPFCNLSLSEDGRTLAFGALTSGLAPDANPFITNLFVFDFTDP